MRVKSLWALIRIQAGLMRLLCKAMNYLPNGSEMPERNAQKKAFNLLPVA